MTRGALAAVETVRREGRGKRLDEAVALIVTDVGRPARAPFDGVAMTAGARSLAKLARDAGFEVREHMGADFVTVEGVHPDRVGFSATWLRGRFKRGSWHEPWRYEMIRDDRPVGMDAKTRVGKVGTRSPGVGKERMTIAGSPRGVAAGDRDLRARIGAVRGA